MKRKHMMRKNKKALVISLILALALALSGCGTVTAEDTATGFLDALVDQDAEEMGSYCSEEADLDLSFFEGLFAGEEPISLEYSDLKVEEKEKVATATYHFKYEQGEEAYESPGVFTLKKIDGEWKIVSFGE